MAVCKICVCGGKIVAEDKRSFPDICPYCGRSLLNNHNIYDENAPEVSELLNEHTEKEENNYEETFVSTEKVIKEGKYALVLDNGKEISIPDEGGIIGREELGAEELSEYPSVSRQHIRVIIRRNIGVLIEDISSYGTLVDGHRINKNEPVRVEPNSKITLCNVDAILLKKEG